MKGPAIPFLALVLILGMSSMATAQLQDGKIYDFFGTVSMEVRDARPGTPCSLPPPATCPQTTNFCITGLVAGGGGTSLTGPATAPYGINVGDIVPGGIAPTVTHTGIGQVQLTVGSATSNADVLTSLNVGECDAGGGSCATAATTRCLNSWTSNSPSTSGGAGSVVTGVIPIQSSERPNPPTGCGSCGLFSPFPLTEWTTETAGTSLTNAEYGTTSYSTVDAGVSGGLTGLDLIISTAEGAPKPLPFLLTDPILVLTLDGTLCDASGGTCATGCP